MTVNPSHLKALAAATAAATLSDISESDPEPSEQEPEGKPGASGDLNLRLEGSPLSVLRSPGTPGLPSGSCLRILELIQKFTAPSFGVLDLCHRPRSRSATVHLIRDGKSEKTLGPKAF